MPKKNKITSSEIQAQNKKIEIENEILFKKADEIRKQLSKLDKSESKKSKKSKKSSKLTKASKNNTLESRKVQKQNELLAKKAELLKTQLIKLEIKNAKKASKNGDILNIGTTAAANKDVLKMAIEAKMASNAIKIDTSKIKKEKMVLSKEIQTLKVQVARLENKQLKAKKSILEMFILFFIFLATASILTFLILGYFGKVDLNLNFKK